MRGNFITDRTGVNNPNYKDGRKNTRLYSIYNNMITRCYNPKGSSYKHYGGRGIQVCEAWLHGFESFYKWTISNGYQDDLSLDRINNNGNYTPDNCRWVTAKQQAINRRNNHIVNINGTSKTLIEWCELYGINYKTVRDRLKRGWNYYDALTIPVETKFRKKVI